MKDILEAILASPSRQLFSLTISDARDDHINAITPLLSNPNAPCRIEELYLKDIDITDSASALGDILSCQSNISLFEAYCLRGTTTNSRFITGIINLLQRPDFKHLSLKHTTFSIKVLKTLITTFLTTPCSQAQSVILFTSITGSASELEHNLYIPQSAQEFKSLEILTHTNSATINPWLLSLQPLKLKSLCISSFHSNRQMLALAANHTSLHVSHLHLNLTEFSTEHFHTLLENASLKELQLVPNGAVGLSDITHGLVKIGEKETLETLTVNSFTPYSPNNMVGYVKPSSRDEIEQFGETLFSLPHLNRFSLELSIEFDQSSDMTDFFETMYKSWERTSKRLRLKKFVLNFIPKAGQLPPLDENLQTMAEEIGMKVKFKLFYQF